MAQGPPGEEGGLNRRRHWRPLPEVFLVFAAATVANAGLYQLGRVVPFVGNNLQAFVAAVFLYLPVAMASRRGEDAASLGFGFGAPRRTLAFGLGGPLLVFPLFLCGYVWFYQVACSNHWETLAPRALCVAFRGWNAVAHPRAPADFAMFALTQVVVVAIPEELFFRGYLQKRLEEALPPRRRFLGGGLGAALLLQALLFALAHFAMGGDPTRLAVFFPGLLFGWVRSATCSIAAGAFIHAASNLYIAALQRTFFA